MRTASSRNALNVDISEEYKFRNTLGFLRLFTI